MPLKPSFPCRHYMCPNLAVSNGYCDIHKKQAQRQQDQQRGNFRERGYISRWDKVRKIFLNSHPLCAECQKQGVVKAANVVDHIKAHKGNQDLMWDESNWQS